MYFNHLIQDNIMSVVVLFIHITLFSYILISYFIVLKLI